MYKNFNLTESEKEQILNRLKENGYKKPINEQKAQPRPATNNALAVAKEMVTNIIAGNKLYVSKVLPGYMIFNQQGMNAFRKGQYRVSMEVSAFQLKPSNTANVIFKDLYVSDESATGITDASSFMEYLNQSNPTNLHMTFENSQYANMELWRLMSFIKYAGISIADALNMMKQLDPNIAQRVESSWGYNNGGLADEGVRKEVQAYIAQSAPQQPAAQPAAQQNEMPLNEGQMMLKDVFNSLI